jgi:hypothetical protein
LQTKILPLALAIAIGCAVTNVIVVAGCAGTPTNVTTTNDPQAMQAALAMENRLALAIATGQVNNAISGAIEAPVSLRDLPNVEDGRPPVYLHAFKTTGELIRDAQISVFWKDEKSVAFVVDNVPAQYPTVLVATIEPGIVMRAVVPPASAEKPAMGQLIDAKSEMIVRKMTDQGMMPPVGLGGLASVMVQGGVDPLASAQEAEKAAAEYEVLANSEWGQDIPEAKQLAADLRTLASIQRSLAPGAAAQYRIQFCGSFCDNVGSFFQNLFGGAQKVQQKVEQKKVTNPPPALVNDSLTRSSGSFNNAMNNSLISRSGNGVVAPGSGNLIGPAGGNVIAPGGGNVIAPGGGNVIAPGGGNVIAPGGGNVIAPGGGNVIAPGGGNVIAPGGGNVVAPGGANLMPRFFKSSSSAIMNLADLYAEGKALAKEKLGVKGPQGQPFTEAEIAEALASGQGPYHTECRDVSFDGTRQSCTTVVNPMGAQEVLITRAQTDYEAFVREFMAAHKAGDAAKVKQMLDKSTITAFNYLYDDDRWKSPVGTWRVRLLQDAGNSTIPKGYSLLADAEVVIGAPGKTDQERLSSGTFEGVISAWLPDSGKERLDNFALKFDWDKGARTLKNGLITGEDRGLMRVLRRATFGATLNDTNTRMTGQWTAEDNSTNGRFEMIRGTAKFTLK